MCEHVFSARALLTKIFRKNKNQDAMKTSEEKIILEMHLALKNVKLS